MTSLFPARIVARRTLSASLVQIGAQAATMITGLARTIILARLLAPEDFGIVVLALLLTDTVWGVTGMGIDARLVQKREMDPEGVATHLTLRIGLSVLAFLAILAAAPFFGRLFPEAHGLSRIVSVLAGINILKAFNLTPLLLLRRNLAFHRLALIGVTASIVMLAAAPLMAAAGWGVWSLVLGESLVGVLVNTLGLWSFRRPVRFSVTLDRDRARDFFGFGWRVMLNNQLAALPNRLADFWTGLVLGKTALGFYSKAFEFAGYPRRVIYRPLQSVLFSTYSRLQHDRLNLSRAFFRAGGGLVRAVFLLAPLLALIFPELVGFLIGEKWMPMVPVFRILIVYSLLNPLLSTGENLFIAVGAPGLFNRIRFVQLMFFAPALILGAGWGGLPGVAMAVNGMPVVGLILFFRMARRFVDFSLLRLLGPPTTAALAGLAMVFLLHAVFPGVPSTARAVLKIGSYAFTYLLVLAALEHAEYRKAIRDAVNLLKTREDSAVEGRNDRRP